MFTKYDALRGCGESGIKIDAQILKALFGQTHFYTRDAKPMELLP